MDETLTALLRERCEAISKQSLAHTRYSKVVDGLHQIKVEYAQDLTRILESLLKARWPSRTFHIEIKLSWAPETLQSFDKWEAAEPLHHESSPSIKLGSLDDTDVGRRIQQFFAGSEVLIYSDGVIEHVNDSTSQRSPADVIKALADIIEFADPNEFYPC